MPGKIYVVGLGPGGDEHITPAARAAIAAAEVVAGYQTYLDLIPQLTAGKELLASGMLQEVERCRAALQLAAGGRCVALVCSGDAGIYGMAGLVLELEQVEFATAEIAVEIVPGVSAVQAAAARLGAPLMHDFAVISLSDLLTPWATIRRRLEAASAADFVVALYNPKSSGRVTQIAEAQALLLASRPSATPVGIVRHACRAGEEVIVSDLGSFLNHTIDMFSLVIVGNSSTVIDGRGRMVTPRGYSVRCESTPPFAKGGAGGILPGTTQANPPLSFRPGVWVPFVKGGGTPARALFVGGTGSDVGKSVITAGLCRLLKRRGYDVAPFKAQNMALNSAVTPQGGEIGRAQALQAAACGLAPHTDMNPILLKPNSHTGSQVVVQGRPVGNMSVAEYHRYKPEAFARVEESFRRLAAAHAVVVLEGAGSIAEINLKAHDIVNLRAAAMAKAPVILVADIDRGGVFASILGTLELLEPAERAMVVGVIINRFRGDASLLTSGLAAITARTGVPVLGVVPWLDLKLPEEDSVALARKGQVQKGSALRIGVVRLPHISNYTDFDPFENEPDVELCYLTEPGEVAGLDLLIIPGSKSTIPDLQFLRRSGLARAIFDFRAAGGEVVGICGGYQMLGRSVADPLGIEGPAGQVEGLGLLDVATSLAPQKQTFQATATPLAGSAVIGFAAVAAISGYEIHMGETTLGPLARPLFALTRVPGHWNAVEDGAVATDGRVWGTYLHGLFDNRDLFGALLTRLRRRRGLAAPAPGAQADLEGELDRLADHLAAHLDLDAIFAGLIPPGSAA